MHRTAFLFMALLAVVITSAQTLEHTWTRRVGSQNDNDKLWATAVDGQGNVYATGVLNGTFSEQGISVTSIGLEDILLAKYDADGTLLWARVAGGPSIDNAYGITCDAVGNVDITGFYVDFAVFGDTSMCTGDPNNAILPFHFVARYTPDGALAWVRSAEATWEGLFGPACIGNDIELDRTGDLVVAGRYFSPNESDGLDSRYCVWTPPGSAPFRPSRPTRFSFKSWIPLGTRACRIPSAASMVSVA